MLLFSTVTPESMISTARRISIGELRAMYSVVNKTTTEADIRRVARDHQGTVVRDD